MGAASFLLPEEALMQRAPGAAAAHVPRVPAAGLAHQPLDDLLAPANPVPGAEFLAGTGLETLEAPALGYDSKFGMSPCNTSSSHSTVHPPASGHGGRLTLSCLQQICGRPRRRLFRTTHGQTSILACQ